MQRGSRIFLKVICLLCLAWFVLEGKVVSFPPSFTNHFHHLCLKMSKPFHRYKLLNQSLRQNKTKKVIKSGWKSGSQIQLCNPKIHIFKRPMEDTWNTSTYWWHRSNSVICETAKETQNHTTHMDVEVGIQGKAATGRLWQQWNRGQRGSGFSILAGFQASDMRTLSQWGQQPCFEWEMGQDRLPRSH